MNFSFLNIFIFTFPIVSIFGAFVKKNINYLIITIYVLFAVSKERTKDLEVYYDIYLNGDINMIFSSSYYLFSFLFSFLGIPFDFFLASIISISCISTIKCLNNIFNRNNFSTLIFIATFLFIEIFFQSTHLIRQFLAMSILLYILSEKKISHVNKNILILLISTIHSVALIGILVLNIAKFKIKFLSIVVAFSFLSIALFGSTILEFRFFKILTNSSANLDNHIFGENGILFIYISTGLILVSFFLKHFKLDETIKFLFLILVFTIVLQFSPDYLNTVKYRFILFSYLPATIIIFNELIFWCEIKKIKPHFVILPILLFLSIRFYNKFNLIFEYNFDPLDLILIQ
jgi:hypothetical protein